MPWATEGGVSHCDKSLSFKMQYPLLAWKGLQDICPAESKTYQTLNIGKLQMTVVQHEYQPLYLQIVQPAVNKALNILEYTIAGSKKLASGLVSKLSGKPDLYSESNVRFQK